MTSPRQKKKKLLALRKMKEQAEKTAPAVAEVVVEKKEQPVVVQPVAKEEPVKEEKVEETSLQKEIDDKRAEAMARAKARREERLRKRAEEAAKAE